MTNICVRAVSDPSLLAKTFVRAVYFSIKKPICLEKIPHERKFWPFEHSMIPHERKFWPLESEILVNVRDRIDLPEFGEPVDQVLRLIPPKARIRD